VKDQKEIGRENKGFSTGTKTTDYPKDPLERKIWILN